MAKSKRIKYATDSHSHSDSDSVGDVINENEWKPMRRQPETNPSVEIAVLLIIRRIVRRTDVQRCICGFITHYLCAHTHTHIHRHIDMLIITTLKWPLLFIINCFASLFACCIFKWQMHIEFFGCLMMMLPVPLCRGGGNSRDSGLGFLGGGCANKTALRTFESKMKR